MPLLIQEMQQARQMSKSNCDPAVFLKLLFTVVNWCMLLDRNQQISQN